MRRVHINGKDKEIPPYVTYEDLCRLAGFPLTATPSIIWYQRNTQTPNRTGVLHRGDPPLVVREGTVFTVSATIPING